MALKTYTEQLEEVQAAISAVLDSGQSYTIGRQTFSRADLLALQSMERRLRPLVNREVAGLSGGIRVRGVIPCD